MNRLIVALSGATDTRGFQAWREVGRQVRKGSSAVWIVAPVTGGAEVRMDDGSVEKRRYIVGVKGVPVFRLEDTDVFDADLWEQNRPDPAPVREFLDGLPFRRVAEHWGLTIEAYNAQHSRAQGWYVPGDGIALGVANLSTWAHEMVHAAEDRLGELRSNGNARQARAHAEVVAELGGAVLLCMIGREEDADAGGCWEYLHAWGGENPAQTAYALIGRVCKAVDLLLETDAMLTESPMMV